MQKILSLTLALMLGVSHLSAKEKSNTAQQLPLKIGYVNLGYIVEALPETKSIVSECTILRKQLKKQIEIKVEDYNKKIQAFRKDYQTMDETTRNQKVSEFQQLEESLGRLELELQEKVENKRNSLLQPVYGKIQNAIAQIAQENGYTYVLCNNIGSMPILVYGDETHNISNRVLRKLGVDPDKAEDKGKK